MKYLFMKVIKYPYVILMIKDIFFLMEYIDIPTKIYQQDIPQRYMNKKFVNS